MYPQSLGLICSPRYCEFRSHSARPDVYPVWPGSAASPMEHCCRYSGTDGTSVPFRVSHGTRIE